MVTIGLFGTILTILGRS